ncbi:N-6 DNA methylase, partial [archaeon]|nr:N-6 DNA methylase [archaeon]
AYHRKIKFSVLTNFKYIRVYHALSNIKNIDKNLLFWLEFKDFEKEFEKLWLLSRESFEKQEINKLLSKKDEQKYKSIDESILIDLLEIRELLSKDLKKLRNYLGDEKIDEAIQILINRFIFMRSVEDRGLENKNFLLGIRKDFREGRLRKRLWDALEIQFRIFDKMYNSKLFAPGILEDEKDIFFDDNTLDKIIWILYFGTEGQQARYMFDQIPSDLLGGIYEQYLGTILRGTDKRVRLEKGTSKRKNMGIYYTPSYIVDYIVKNSVGEYIKYKTIDEILEVKIVDPACGSGSFLIRAFQEICDVIEENLKRGEKAKKYQHTFQEFKGKLSLGEKATILTNCIYGVDLDEKAVELAQLNLLLKILEEEGRDIPNKRLPTLFKNIENGNSLIDDRKVAGSKAFNWDAQFPFKFDVVIGNPPYVDIKGMPSKEVKFLFKKYQTPENRINLYSIFVEKATQLLKEKGYFGYIIPNSILFNSSYNKIRKLLLEKVVFDKIIRLPDDIFGEAKVETIILIFKNRSSLEDDKTTILTYNGKDKINSVDEDTAKQVLRTNQNLWKNNEEFVFNIFANEEVTDLIKKIEKDKEHLIKLADFSLGVTPYDKYKGHTPSQIKNKVFHADKQKDKNFKRLLSGGDIVRYGIFWNEKQWIKYGKELGAPREQRFFIKPRIIVRQIISGNPLRIYAGYSEEEFYNAQIAFNILLKDETKFNIKYLLALINSNLINFYHSEKFLDKSKNLFQKILIQNAKLLPIKFPTSEQEKKIIELVDEMLEAQKKFHNGKVVGKEKEDLERQIKDIDYEIDQEVYKLYDITKEDQEIIEKSLK